MARWLKIAVPALIVVAGVGVMIALIRTRPVATQAEPAERAPVVSVEALRPVTEPVEVSVQGTVVPARQVQVQPQVSGRVVWVNPRFTPGGRVAEGEDLFRIEQQDYRLALNQAQAGVERAQVELEVERGRQGVARLEFESYAARSTNATSNPLLLREPQLKAAEAALQAARSGAEQARLALARTAVKAPFNALVQAAAVEVGQTVAPQLPVGTLVGTDAFWVRAAVAPDKLDWIRFAGDGRRGSRAVIRQDTGRDTARWSGRVLRLLGDLEPGSRMARILVEVDDPLQLRAKGVKASQRRLPLLLGAFVDVAIEGPVLEGVYRIPRAAVRENDRLFILRDENRLEIRAVDVAWRTADHVYVSGGVRAGERLVVSRLATPVDGMKLTLEAAGGAEAAGPEPAGKLLPPAPGGE